MPVINILFWATIILAALLFWRIHAYLNAAEEEAARQYQRLLIEEHMCEQRIDYESRSGMKQVLARNNRNRVAASTIRRVATTDRRSLMNRNRKSNYRKGHRTVA